MARRSVAATMPAKLWMLSAGLVLLSVAWGMLGGWIVSQHASAASDVVHVDEPLALAAQRMYESISDADVTATTTTSARSNPVPRRAPVRSARWRAW